MQGRRLDQLRKAAAFESMAEFARAAGIKEVTADKHIQRDKVPLRRAEKYIDAARHTGADLAWLLTGKGKAPKTMSRSELIHVAVTPAKVTANDMDEVPPQSVRLWTVVRAHVPGGSVLVTESDEMLPAPGHKRISKSSFVLQIWDNANSPGLRRGSHIYVDRLKIPGEGQWCVLASAADGSEPPTLYKPIVGILSSIEDGAWKLLQGANFVRLAQEDWPLAWLIVLLDPI